MTTVFSSSFAENLQRLKLQQELQRQTADNSSAPKSKPFSQLLADLEKKPEVLPEKIIPPSVSFEEARAQLGHSLTNFVLRTEDKNFNTSLPQKFVGREGSRQNESLLCSGVVEECKVPAVENAVVINTVTTSGTKRTPLQPDAEEPPPAPVIKEMKRISMQVPAASVKNPPQYSRAELESIIDRAGKYHGVDPSLSMAVAQAESSFRPDVTSRDGHASKGMFQLLDSTAADLLNRFEMKDQYDPFDPALNAHLGVGYLRRLHDLFSTSTELGGSLKTFPANSSAQLEKVALAAYNAGEGNVAQAQRRAEALGKDPGNYAAIEPFLPPSTREYVRRVTEYKVQIAKSDDEETVA